jgi:hypothetical protein
LRQCASSVEITLARLIGCRQQAFVLTRFASKASRDRPQRGANAEIEQHCVRHEPRDAAVAVEERVNPKKPMMSCGHRYCLTRLCKASRLVGLLESSHECGKVFCRRRKVPTNRHAPRSKFAWDDCESLVRVRIINGKQAGRQSCAEFPVRPFNECSRGRWSRKRCARIDHLLHLYMRARFQLQIAAKWVSGIVSCQSSVNVARMGVVALDQIGVVAIHRPD